jgi:hypothetical protein
MTIVLLSMPSLAVRVDQPFHYFVFDGLRDCPVRSTVLIRLQTDDYASTASPRPANLQKTER